MLAGIYMILVQIHPGTIVDHSAQNKRKRSKREIAVRLYPGRRIIRRLRRILKLTWDA